MGRCPVKSVSEEALAVLKKNQHKLGYVSLLSSWLWLLWLFAFADWLLHMNRFMSDKIMPLTQAVEGYDIFNAMKVQKVIFEADK